MTQGISGSGNPSKTVIVVGDFTNKKFDLDRDNIKDISSGRMASACIQAENKDVFVMEKDIGEKGNEKSSLKKATRKMASILKYINNGGKVDGVNLSFSSSAHYTQITDVLDIKGLSPQNIEENKSDIKTKLFQQKDKYAKTLTKLIKQTEEIAKKGIPVFVSAGNDGKNSYNLVGLAEGTTMVGGTYPDGTKIKDYAQNSDVDIYENAVHTAIPEYEESQKEVNPLQATFGEPVEIPKAVGYDINNDGEIDIDAKETSSKGKKSAIVSYSDNSMASATALAKELKKTQ